MSDILHGFKKHRAGRIHVKCRGCGRKLSNMPRSDFDPANAVLVVTVCEKHDTGCGGPEEFYYDAEGKEIVFDDDDIDYLFPTPDARRPRHQRPRHD